MSANVTPENVSKLVFGAAAVAIVYRIATSPERGSRSPSPTKNKDIMAVKTRRVMLSPVADNSEEFLGTRSAKQHADAGYETPEIYDEGVRATARSRQPPGRRWLSRTMGRGLPEEIAYQPRTPRSNVQVEHPNGEAGQPESNVGPEQYNIKAKLKRRKYSVALPENAMSVLPERSSAESSRPRRKDRTYSTEDRFMRPEYSQKVARLWRSHWLAYVIGIALFFAAARVFLRVDRYYTRQQDRIPGAIISVLFLEPLHKYTEMQERADEVASRIGETRTTIDGLAKAFPRCGWGDVGGQPDFCGFTGVVHHARDELARLKFGIPKVLRQEVKHVCYDLVELRSEFEAHANDTLFVADRIDRLIKQRASQAMSIRNVTNKESDKISGVYHDRISKLLPWSQDKVEQLVPEPELSFTPTDIEKNLSSIQNTLNMSVEAPTGEAMSEIKQDALQVSNRAVQLHRWLMGKPLDGDKLLQKLNEAAQSEVIERTCNALLAQHERREGLHMPHISIPSISVPNISLTKILKKNDEPVVAPWYSFGRKAMCQRMCDCNRATI